MELRKRRAHPDAELRRRGSKRLVHQERLRLADDRPPHGDTLPLPARQLRGLALEELLETELGDPVDTLADLGLGHAPDLEAVPEVLPDAHVRVERVALEDHRDVTMARSEVGDVAASDRDLSARHLLESGDRAQQRRLPAARRPDERDELAVADRERHIVDRDDVSREDLREVRSSISAMCAGMDTTFPHNWY